MTDERPVFGVTCCHKAAGGEMVQTVIDRYAFAAMRWADAAALLIPATPGLVDAREVAARLDGLMLTGSPSNIAPELYGEASAADDGPFDPARDETTFALIEAMIARGKPVFGVCRGFQEVNVAFGGTLNRRVSVERSMVDHHAPEGASLEAMFGHGHEVAVTPGGVLAGALGRERLWVNSVHFQGVARLGSGLVVEARAADSLVEAVSARINGTLVLAVQWHPEWRTEADAASQALFALFGRALRGDPRAAIEGAKAIAAL